MLQKVGKWRVGKNFHELPSEKNQNSFEGVKIRRFVFYVIVLNHLKNSVMTLILGKIFNWGCFLVKKSHFRDPIDIQSFFHVHHQICLVKTLHLSTHMTIFVARIFLIEKTVKKLVETQKFC